MICSRLRLALFLDAHGELGIIRAALVRHHTRRCAACRAQHEAWREEAQAWRRAATGEEGMPASSDGRAELLRQAIATRIRHEPGGRAAAVHPTVGRTSSLAPRPWRVSHRALSLVTLALVLLISLSALGAFGPPLARRAGRWWHRVTCRTGDCDRPATPSETPPGDPQAPP